MDEQMNEFQAKSSPSKIEGAGGSMKISLTFCQNCYYRNEVILPLYPPTSPAREEVPLAAVGRET